MSNWPDELCVDSEVEAAARAALESTCATMRLSDAEAAALVPPVLGLASWLLKDLPKPAVIGLAGSQGSGKSTIAELLEVAFLQARGMRVARLSIDDFYLTRAEREVLGNEVHPLLRKGLVLGWLGAEHVLGELLQRCLAVSGRVSGRGGGFSSTKSCKNRVNHCFQKSTKSRVKVVHMFFLPKVVLPFQKTLAFG